MKKPSQTFCRDKNLRKRLRQMEDRKAQKRIKKRKTEDEQSPSKSNQLSDNKEASSSHQGENEFASLKLSEPIMRALEELAFETMTPVQRACLHCLVQERKDALVSARTGSGKTLAYVIPMIQRLREFKPKLYSGTCAIILVPTRELAIQVYGVVQSFSQHTTFRTLCMTGGRKRAEELNEILRGCSIVVATPGRLLSYLLRRTTRYTNNKEKALKSKETLNEEWERDGRLKMKAREIHEAFEREEVDEEAMKEAREAVSKATPYKVWFPVHNLQTLIVDEVDRMLEQGFSQTLLKIRDQLPPMENRQTMLFSATINKETEEIAKGLMRPDYERIAVTDSKHTEAGIAKPLDIEAVYVLQDPADKLVMLLNLIGLVFGPGKKIMLFVSCIPEAEYLTKLLCLLDIHSQNVFAMHSKMPENDRRSTFLRFCRVNTALLVCTDVAARGLDVPDVDWVIQFDPPRNVNEYMHRVGRTGRAGATGNALLLLRPNEVHYLPDLVSHIGCITHWRDFPMTEAVTLEKLQKFVQSVNTLHQMAVNAYFGILKSYLAYPRKYYDQVNLEAMAHSLGLKKPPKISGENLRNQVARIAVDFQPPVGE